MSVPIPHVAIIGAGLGGLTLVSLLEHRKTPVKLSVFEADASTDARLDQGGSLDLKQESGQKALQAAGLHEKFLKICRPEGGDVRVLDKNSVPHLDMIDDGDMYNPEIDRTELRQLLLDSISPETIQWNHKVVRITRNDTSSPTYTIEFADPSQERVIVDIIIGADGAWSKTRAMSPVPCLPEYTGITFLDFTLADYQAKYPNISKTVGRGTLLALNDAKGIVAQCNANKIIRVYAALKIEESWQKESDVAHVNDTASRVQLLTTKKGYFADWSNELQDLLRGSESKPSFMRPIYALPISYLRDPPKNDSHIVLLGDAAHLMSPFAGEGVNLAMADALDAANALASITVSSSWSRVGISDALRKYEAQMWRRALGAATESAQNLETFFGENAPTRVKELFESLGPPKIVIAGMKLFHRLFSGFW